MVPEKRERKMSCGTRKKNAPNVKEGDGDNMTARGQGER